MTIALFIAVLFFLILVHELGHFITAKWAKMRVDEFAIGFPPRLFKIRKGETDYSINLLPIGGYVKIFGENGENEGDRTRAFGSRPRLHQAIVLLAGVTMNVLTAWIIFFVVAMVGVPTAVSETSPEASGAELTITGVLENTPAAEAELTPGLVIQSVEVNGITYKDLTPSTLSELVEKTDSDLTLNYKQKDELKSVTISPQANIIEGDPEREAIGISTALVTTIKQNPLEALITATTKTWVSLKAITIGIVSFFASAFTLSADIEQVTGPIGIAGMVGEAAEFGFTSLLIFTAFISLNLAVINLLPIPALDGGRLLFVLIEAIIRRPINPEWMGRVNFVGFALLILLMIAVTYNDIARIF